MASVPHALGLFWSLCLLPPAAAAAAPLNVGEQVVVFDAGSSGTRVHVYDFVWDGTVVPTLDASRLHEQELKVRPGLSTLSTIENAKELQEATLRAFQPLLEFVRKIIPASARKDTPLILKATAGLRMMPPAKADRCLEAVRTLFLESEFFFRPHRGWADVIPGREEAGLAWIAANFLKKVFDTRFDDVGRTASVGIVEMGGGSTQVSFHVHDSANFAQLDPDRQFLFRDFHGHEFQLYAASYLGFGRDHALRRFDKTLSHLGSETNPCHTKGYVAEKGSPQMTGTGEYAACLSRIEELLFNSSTPDQPVVIPGSSDPHGMKMLEGSFLATEVFYYAREHAPMRENETWQDFDLSSSKVVELGNRLCESIGSAGQGDSGSDNGCFSIPFQTALLKHVGATGEHLPTVTKDINDVQVEWALGAAVQYLASTVKEKSNMNNDDPADAIVGESVMFMLGVTFFALLMIFMLARTAMQWQPFKLWATRVLRRNRRRGRRNRHKYRKVAQREVEEFGLREKNIEAAHREKGDNIVIEMQINSRASRGPAALKWKFNDHDSSGSDSGLPAI